MTPERFRDITSWLPRLRVAVVGDFCLDRYLEIDPARTETSIETGLPVYNVVRVRAQPGAAGTILNNLVALGIGEIHVVGFCGDDGEGYELRKALSLKRGVHLDNFVSTPDRRTFTYCKPLIVEAGQPPRELNRLDSKNWQETPQAVQKWLVASVAAMANRMDAIILMDQVDVPETGVVTRAVCEIAHSAQERHAGLLVVADSRSGLAHFPPFVFKMNAAELAVCSGEQAPLDQSRVCALAAGLARKNGRMVFVTLAEQGVIGATPEGEAIRVPAFPVRSPIDIVGAGDSVTANLTAALAAKATPAEAMELAMAAASTVVHQVGTTGEATVEDLARLVARGEA